VSRNLEDGALSMGSVSGLGALTVIGSSQAESEQTTWG
jgi:hypothetical protein